MANPSTYPVRVDADYPEHSSRGLAFLGILLSLKALLLIPHYIVLIFVNLIAFILAWLSFWAILFTGKYPRGMFNFVWGSVRWNTRTNAWLYSLTDRYPPFSLD